MSPYLMDVPVLFEDAEGFPESAGTLRIRPAVAGLLADGVLRMEPVWMQLNNHEKQLMEIKLLPAHEEARP